jgi:hypothetical protein
MLGGGHAAAAIIVEANRAEIAIDAATATIAWWKKSFEQR